MITGSRKRLGAYTAQFLHKLGYNIVLHCHHSTEAAQQLLNQLNEMRAKSAIPVQADITQIQNFNNLLDQALSGFGRLDVLINNASSFYPTPIGSIGRDDWQSLVGTNMQAPLFLTQMCKKHLEKNQGVVINMVDIHAERPLKDHTLYCMAKAALVTMTESLAQEMAPAVRVNGVAPGAIMWPEKHLDEQDKKQILKQIPLNKLGSQRDIAQAIHFLIEASYITGHILKVDGGRSIASQAKA